MHNKLNKIVNDESGVTALETAIILIAFVVVAAIFAFTILSTGTFLTDRSKEAALSGLEEVRGSMEVKGGVVLQSSGTISDVVFTVANAAGGSPVDLTATPGKQVVQITYRDANQNKNLNVQSGTALWDVAFLVDKNGDSILEQNELAELTLHLDSLSPKLAPNQTFNIEIKPPKGATLSIQRSTPARLDTVTDLH